MTSPPDVELAELLHELFDGEELQRFLRRYYRELADCLPTNLGRTPLASAAAEALARRNLIDGNLFERLHTNRLQCKERIDRAARVYDLRYAPKATRWRPWIGAIAALIGLAGGIVLMRNTASSEVKRCMEDDGCEEASEHSVASDQPFRKPDPTTSTPGTLGCPSGMALIDDVHGVRPMCLDRSEVTRGAFCSSLIGTSKVDESDIYRAARCEPDTNMPDWPRHPITHVRSDEAVAYCADRGLQLPDRHDFVRILQSELGERILLTAAEAMNVCGVECHKNERPQQIDFKHSDLHERTAPVGAYRRRFSSPHGLDDMFGNAREIVRDGSLAFACGSGWTHTLFAELDPETCLDEQNEPLPAERSIQSLGFRCAGVATSEPGQVVAPTVGGR